jgi:AraC-like DNA-binding protein
LEAFWVTLRHPSDKETVFMAADILSDVLKEVHLSGALFFDVEGRAPWVAEAPPSCEFKALVMPHAQHMINYHVVANGVCWARLLDSPDQPVRLTAGSVIVFPQGQPHVLSSEPGLRAPFDPAIFDAPQPEGLKPLMLSRNGDGPQTVRLICGFLGCDVLPFNPLLQGLPGMLIIADGYSDRDGWLASLIRAAAAEGRDRREGGRNVLSRLSELIFIEAVRIHAERLPQDARGWLAALRIPHVARAIGLLHDEPARAWTLSSLARASGVSRTVLAGTFRDTLGTPPMSYLASWRMQIAAGLLADTETPVYTIAEKVGYESEASFSRAFRRATGLSPGIWRNERQRNEPSGRHETDAPSS